MGFEDALPNVTFIRLLRLAKLMKVMRIVRVMRFFRELRVLVVSIACSVKALVWSILLLTIVQIIGSIGITQTCQEFVVDESEPLETRVEVFQYFGRWTNSMLTLFQMTIAPGGFVQPCRLLVYKISRLYVFFFIPYTWGVTFAIIRVITAMFLKETLAVAAQDQENAVMEREKKKKRDVEHLRVIFEEADMDG